MAKVLALFLLALLAISMLHTHAFGLVIKPPGRPGRPGRPGKPPVTPGTVLKHQCAIKCSGLCSKTKSIKPCLQLCMKCCKKCKCLPLGNNKANCPCKC